jgi:hypothetical protein
MSMTQKQIDELESAVLYRDWRRVNGVICAANSEAHERALPVTREWLADESQGYDADRDGYRFGEYIVLPLPTGQCVVRLERNWNTIAYVTTRGQLLDLLSGLGATK